MSSAETTDQTDGIVIDAIESIIQLESEDTPESKEDNNTVQRSRKTFMKPLIVVLLCLVLAFTLIVELTQLSGN